MPNKKPVSKNTTRLIIASPEEDANLLWASGFLAPDPILFVEHAGKKHLILNDLEVDRGRKEARVDQVWSYSELEQQAAKKKPSPRMFDVLEFFLKKQKIRQLHVPYDFPIAYGEALKARKFSLKIQPEPFYPDRVRKTPAEIQALRQVLKHVSTAIQEAYQVLRESEIRRNKIYWQGKILTSEILRQVINLSLMRNNCLGKHTIVAGGEQGVDPHCEGYGPLPANQPIIMDVFPRSMDSQYFGDMTRTVVKGKASPEFKKQWQTVKYAQEHAMTMIREGVDGQKVHGWINEHFESQGYVTGVRDGRMQGFFHGTGHGLGLEIHEAPRVSKVSHVLSAGEVVTVEPGLYYRGVGGVRIEDVVLVTKKGCELLSKCPKILEIP